MDRNPDDMTNVTTHLNDADPVYPDEGYRRLVDVPEGASRQYMKQIYVDPEGFMCATNAHVLSVVSVSFDQWDHPPARPFCVPVLKFHKTDDIYITEDDISIICDHSTDYSIQENITGIEDYPNIAQVIPTIQPDPDPVMILNSKYVKRAGDPITPDNDSRPMIMCPCNGNENPILCMGQYGFSIIMPMRTTACDGISLASLDSFKPHREDDS